MSGRPVAAPGWDWEAPVYRHNGIIHPAPVVQPLVTHQAYMHAHKRDASATNYAEPPRFKVFPRDLAATVALADRFGVALPEMGRAVYNHGVVAIWLRRGLIPIWGRSENTETDEERG